MFFQQGKKTISLRPAAINLFQEYFQFKHFGIFCLTRHCGAFPTGLKGDSQELYDFAVSRWAVQAVDFSLVLCGYSESQLCSYWYLSFLVHPSPNSYTTTMWGMHHPSEPSCGTMVPTSNTNILTDMKPNNNTKPCHSPTKWGKNRFKAETRKGRLQFKTCILLLGFRTPQQGHVIYRYREWEQRDSRDLKGKNTKHPKTELCSHFLELPTRPLGWPAASSFLQRPDWLWQGRCISTITVGQAEVRWSTELSFSTQLEHLN